LEAKLEAIDNSLKVMGERNEDFELNDLDAPAGRTRAKNVNKTD
jgi:hypothetical protein